MGINFCNPSRGYEESDHGVRFWGYDNEIEISFIVDERALTKLDSATPATNEGFLSTFDASRERIQNVANNVYVRRFKGSRPSLIHLRDSDF